MCNYDRIKVYIQLHLLYFFFSFIAVLSKYSALFEFGSEKFSRLYIFLLSMTLVYAFFWQQIIKKLPLVIAYSHKGVVIFWVLLWSYMLFGEKISWNNTIGALVILFGIVVVSRNE